MPDPILAALSDTQHRLAAAIAETENERLRRHQVEQLLDSAHELIADQHRLIETLGGQLARGAA